MAARRSPCSLLGLVTLVGLAAVVRPVTLHAGVLTVTSTVDVVVADSACTLREAFLAANGASHPECGAGQPGLDTIAFALPGPGPRTIAVAGRSALPPLTQTVVLDGLSQPASGGASASCVDGPLLVEVVDAASTTANQG